MYCRVTDVNGACCVAVDGEISRSTVVDIKSDIMAVLQTHHEIEVDLSHVEDIDTAGLQLMLAAKRYVNKRVTFFNHSAAVLRVLKLANLGQQLGDPLLIPASDMID
ncbi:MAG: STAS domain-containing protein [Cellvibrio sp.]|nr:STAS domain-containing protein [Cellvibrio sp.]